MTLNRPIVIFGTGRGGTSIFHSVMANHPRAAWLTPAVNRAPDRPTRGGQVMRLLDIPVLGRRIRGLHPPIECYRFWDHISPGFSSSSRDLTPKDLPPGGAQRIREALGAVPTRKRDRLLLKITGWPRLAFLSAALPDARFIHVKRDGRAVANSLLHVSFWRGWEGPEGWRWGPLPPDLEAEWEAHSRSPAALAGIQWRIHMAAATSAMEAAPEGTACEVSYEDLCADPGATCRQVAEFCDLEWTPEFEAAVLGTRLRNTNYKWTRDLPPSDQEILTSVLADDLRRYGYDPESRPSKDGADG
jgi:hypothetical protein